MHKETLDVDGDGDNETSDMTTAYYYDGLDRLAKQVGPDEIELTNRAKGGRGLVWVNSSCFFR